MAASERQVLRVWSKDVKCREHNADLYGARRLSYHGNDPIRNFTVDKNHLRKYSRYFWHEVSFSCTYTSILYEPGKKLTCSAEVFGGDFITLDIFFFSSD